MDDSVTLPVERTGPSPIARISLVGAAAAALVAVAMLAVGATASPAGTLAAGTNAGTTTSGAVLAFGGDGDGFGRGFGRGHGFGGIEITAISGSRLTLETEDGWTRTITVDSGTTYTESGDEIALADLSIGDEIRFQQTREDDGTYTIDAVAVIPPHAGGTVTVIWGSTITVQRRDGTTASIKVTAATSYSVAGDDDAALADVEVGMFLVAEGTENSDGSLTATEVRAADPDSMPGPGGRGGHGHGPWGDNDAADDSAG